MKLFEKYRPCTLSDVIGQEKITQRIQAIIDSGRFAGQAVMVTGKSGTGKTTIARIIAGAIADPMNVQEFDAVDCTPARIGDIENDMQWLGMGAKTGKAWIVNEYHTMRAPAVAKWLTFLERIPAHCVVIFTSTVEGGELFDDQQLDSSPFVSRCLQFSLAQRDLAKPMAQRVMEIAQAENLDGRPLADYLKLANDCKSNMRMMLQRVEAGGMLV